MSMRTLLPMSVRDAGEVGVLNLFTVTCPDTLRQTGFDFWTSLATQHRNCLQPLGYFLFQGKGIEPRLFPDQALFGGLTDLCTGQNPGQRCLGCTVHPP